MCRYVSYLCGEGGTLYVGKTAYMYGYVCLCLYLNIYQAVYYLPIQMVVYGPVVFGNSMSIPYDHGLEAQILEFSV